MKVLAVFLGLATVLIDAFLLHSFSEGITVHVSLVVLVVLIAYARHTEALLFAITSGLIADLLLPGVPFGILTGLQLAVYVLAELLANSFFSFNRFSSVAFFGMSVAAARAVGWISLYVLASYYTSVSGPSRTSLTATLITSILDAALVIGLVYILSIAGRTLKHWFFLVKRT